MFEVVGWEVFCLRSRAGLFSIYLQFWYVRHDTTFQVLFNPSYYVFMRLYVCLRCWAGKLSVWGLVLDSFPFTFGFDIFDYIQHSRHYLIHHIRFLWVCMFVWDVELGSVLFGVSCWTVFHLFSVLIFSTWYNFPDII